MMEERDPVAFWLAVRGSGERVSDVGDILLAQPAQQG